MVTSRRSLKLLHVLCPIAMVTPLVTCSEHTPTQPGEGGIELQVVITSPALPASAPVGTTLPPLQVKVFNKKNGQTLFNEPVNFVVTAGGGSVFAPTVATDNSSGIALDLWTLGPRAGFDTLQARVVDTSRVGPLAGSTSIVTFAIQATPLAAAVISAQAGNGQTAVAGSPLSNSPAVLVTDRFGNPIGGVNVTFALGAGGGSVAGASQTTNASGIATVGSWTLGTTAGPNTLTATAAGLTGSPVTFTATGINAAAMQLIPATSTVFTGIGVAGTIAAATGPAVRVVDRNNNGVPNVAVTFSVTGPSCPSCSLYPGTSPSAPGKIAGVGSITILTDANGRASGGDWTLSTLAGANTLQATAVGLTGSPVIFTATGTAGAAALLFKKAGDAQTSGVGTAVSTPPAVQVTDIYGNPGSSGIAVTFAVQSGGGSVSPATAITDLNGSASAAWTLGATAGSDVLSATAQSLGKSVTFTATTTGPAGLGIADYHGDGQIQSAGITLPIAPAAQVTDQNGHPVLGVTVTFSITAGGGSITGSSQMTDANGIATVGSWSLGPTPGINELQAAFNTGVSSGYTIFVATGTPGNFWTTKASMPTARNDLTAAGVNGLLYAIAGKTGNTCTGLTTVEAYTPATDTWTAKAHLPVGRFNPAAATSGGTLYVVGGDLGCGVRSSELDAYDAANDVWSTQVPMPTARTNLNAAVVNGVLYAIGGIRGNSVVATVEAYDAVTNTWTTKAPMLTARFSAAVGALNGVIYVAGGGGQAGNLASVEAYDPATDTWTNKAPLPMAVSPNDFSGGAVNGRLYVVGGTDATGTTLPTVEAYDPATDSWSTVASLPTIRVRFAVGVVGGVLYAVGGGQDNAVVGTNQTYQP